MTIKAKSHEKLDEANIERVLNSLEMEKPITKKEACEMLNIAYNTTRLSKILVEFKENRKYRRHRMDQNRGKSASSDELSEIVMSYLIGMTYTEISRRMYRSSTFVKNVIDRVGVPTKVALGEELIVPDECVKYEFEEGEWIWFNDNHPDARGGKAGKITKEVTSKKGKREGYKVYGIDYWVPIEWQEGFWVAWWPGIKRFKGRTIKPSYAIASIQHLVDQYTINTEAL